MCYSLSLLCVFVCVISNLSISRKPHLSDLGKTEALLHKTYSKVRLGTMEPRLDLCKSILLLSRVTRKMLHNHPFSQQNKATKRGVGVKVGGRDTA